MTMRLMKKHYWKSKAVKYVAVIATLALNFLFYQVFFETDFVVLYYKYIKHQHLNVSQYVSFDASVADGRRLGNLIFDMAAVLYIAKLTARQPVILNSTHLGLEDVFQLKLERAGDICPCHVLSESRHLSYDLDIESRLQNDRKLSGYSILVSGFRQSWKYTQTIDYQLREQLVFRNEIRTYAEKFLENSVPTGWNRVGFVRVGIHVRRGDNLSPRSSEFGYTIAKEKYFANALKYFTDRYQKLQFIVASDDYNWTKEHVVLPNRTPDRNITYCFNHTAAQDMSILSMCDHVIMSTGTFGWWAAWMAKGTTIYYSDWPRQGSDLFHHFKREDFFPPSWISMSDS